MHTGQNWVFNSRNTMIRGKISKNNVEKHHDESVYFVGVSTIATNRTYVFFALI